MLLRPGTGRSREQKLGSEHPILTTEVRSTVSKGYRQANHEYRYQRAFIHPPATSGLLATDQATSELHHLIQHTSIPIPSRWRVRAATTASPRNTNTRRNHTRTLRLPPLLRSPVRRSLRCKRRLRPPSSGNRRCRHLRRLLLQRRSSSGILDSDSRSLRRRMCDRASRPRQYPRLVHELLRQPGCGTNPDNIRHILDRHIKSGEQYRCRKWWDMVRISSPPRPNRRPPFS